MIENSILPYLNGASDTITFSGHSAGCQFSHTMQIIHSATIKGTGLMECGPYSMRNPDFHKPGASTKELETAAINTIEKYANTGAIDPLENLKDVAVYLVGGKEDPIVPMLAVDAINDVYKHFGTDKIEFLKKHIDHNMRNSDPIAGLKYIYSQLGYYPSGFQPSSEDPYSIGELKTFDQKEFVPEGWSFDDSSFYDSGYYYLPDSCKTGKACNVHFVFHWAGGRAW